MNSIKAKDSFEFINKHKYGKLKKLCYACPLVLFSCTDTRSNDWAVGSVGSEPATSLELLIQVPHNIRVIF